jgi:broad specificity phosphatase PhoE
MSKSAASAKSDSLYIFFVRHGESVFNGQNRIQGHSDSGLSERGRRQAEKVARRLSRFSFKKVYSSDLGRALTTCKTITAAAGKIGGGGQPQRITLDARLREIGLGEWEGLSTDEVNARYRRGYDRWLVSPSRMKVPGAERVHEFHARVRTRVEQIMNAHREGPILVVTHGGVIASLLSHWLKSSFDHTLLNLRIDNTSVTVVEKNPQRVKIHLLNDIGHLGARDVNHKNIFTNR